MRRFISGALTFIMAWTVATGGLTPGFAEGEAEVYSENVDAVPALAEEVDAEGLSVELGEWELVEEEAVEAVEAVSDAELSDAPMAAYAEVTADAARVFDAADGAAFAELGRGAVVLIVKSASNGWTKVAFNTDRGIVTAFMEAAALAEMSADQTNAFLDSLAAEEVVVAYEDDLDRPLAMADCRFIEAETANADAEEGEVLTSEADTEEDMAEAEEADTEESEVPQAEAQPQAGEVPEESEPEAETSDGQLLAAQAEADGEAGAAPETPETAGPVFSLAAGPQVVVVGDSCEIEAIGLDGTPIDAADLLFESSNAEVAHVDEEGVVTALQAGSADIAVTYQGQVLTSAVSVPQEPTEIRLSAAAGTLGVKETYDQLDVEMLPAGSDASVTWSTSNAKVVAVNRETGEIKGVKVGTATITAKTRNGRNAACKVTVKKAPSKVTVTGSLTLGEEQYKRLSASLPKNTASAITWTSSDESVATVSEDGTVTAVSAGQAKITAAAFNGRKGTCTVTVKEPPEGIQLSRQSANLNVKGTLTLKASPLPADAMTPSGFVSSNPEVATVTNAGVVTAKAVGEATITATAYNGVTADCEVHVFNAPSKVTLNRTSATMGAGMPSILLVPTVVGTNVNPDVSWSSNNTKVAKVSGGEVTAIKAGTATITVTTSNGKKASCKITVKAAPSSINITADNVSLGAQGMTAQLKTTVPANSYAGTVTWSSSDESVAAVSDAGLVTAVNPGEADITVTAYNGTSDTCHVKVVPAPGAVVLSASEFNLGVGQKAAVSAEAFAANGGDTLTTLAYFVDPNSPNPNAVTVNADTGAITAVDKGIAWVNVRTHNGVTAQSPAVVTVLPAPAGIKLSGAPGTIGIGEAYGNLTYSLVIPEGENECQASVTWSTSNSKVLTVDSKTGAIKGKKKGTATITVKTHNGKTASCKVHVKKAATKVTLTPATLKVTADGAITGQLKYTLPKDTASKQMIITSSDESVAVVSPTGVVTGVGVGTATISVAPFNGKGAGTCKVTVYGAPGQVAMSAGAITLGVGQKSAVKAAASTADGGETLTAITYFIDDASPNPGAIALAADGTVTAVKTGTAIVNARTYNGVTATDPCVITVLPAPTSVSVANAPGSIGVKESYTLTCAFAPEGNCMGSVTWSTSNAKIATVNSSGVVKGVKAGSATITAKTHNGKTASIKVTVKAAPSKLTLSPASVKLAAGGMHFQLTTSGASLGRWLTFESNNPDVAAVDPETGRITTGQPGAATITARTYNGLSKSCAVTVTDAPARAFFQETSVQLYINEKHASSVTVLSASGAAAMADITYSVDARSANPGCIEVNPDTGEIIAKAKGQAMVSFSTHNDVVAEAACVVTVLAAPTSVSLNAASANIGVGQVYALEAETAGQDDYDDSLTWTSSNEAVVTVDAQGGVTGIGAGTATVTVRTCNGLIAACKFTVKKAPTRISITPDEANLALNKTAQYTVFVEPDGATTACTFTSSNPSVATVNASGKVTAVTTGVVTITATTYNGLTATATLYCGVPADMPRSVAAFVYEYNSGMSNEDKLEYMLYVAQSKLGCKYNTSTNFGPNSFDCVGFSYYCYKQINIKLKDTPGTQANDTRYAKIASMDDLKRGDLVFFHSDTKTTVNHVGIYLGSGYFIHASSSAGKVVVSELKTKGNYYNRNFCWGRRILE